MPLNKTSTKTTLTEATDSLIRSPVLAHSSSEPSLGIDNTADSGTPASASSVANFRNPKPVEDFRTTVDFLLMKNESHQEQVNRMESERKETLVYVNTLKNKLDSLEHTSRATCLEVPKYSFRRN
ncbi:hypothetical protein ACJJTC_002789 [Scirpophaga incertulas]